MKLHHLLLFILILQGCASQGAVRLQEPSLNVVAEECQLEAEDCRWRVHYQAMRAKESFSFTARAALKTKDVSNQFRMEGIVDKGIFIDVMGPFRLGKARLILHPQQDLFALMTKEGYYLAEDEEALTASLFSTEVPVSAFASWMKGIPHDLSLTQTVFDDTGLLHEFYENGFHITLKDYQDAQGAMVPHHITLVKDDFLLRIRISELAPITQTGNQ